MRASISTRSATARAARRFFRDRVRVHTLSATAGALYSVFHHPLRAESINAGSTTDAQLFVRGSAISRYGQPTSRAQHHNIANVSETRTLKRGAGTLQRVTINQNGSASALVQFFNSLTGSGDRIAGVDTVNTSGTLVFDLDFDIGLTYVSSATPGDLTVLFD